MTTPSAGDTLAGTQQFVFTPTAGINITQVYFSASAPGGSSGSNAVTPRCGWAVCVVHGYGLVW